MSYLSEGKSLRLIYLFKEKLNSSIRFFHKKVRGAVENLLHNTCNVSIMGAGRRKVFSFHLRSQFSTLRGSARSLSCVRSSFLRNPAKLLHLLFVDPAI